MIWHFLAQDKNIQNIIRTAFFMDSFLYKEWLFTKITLRMMSFFLFNCVYRRHGLFLSLYVFLTLKFQNFSVGFKTICLFFVFTFNFQTRSVGDLHRIILRWVVIFPLLLFHSSFSKLSLCYILVTIQCCLHRCGIYLNPYLASMFIVDNSILSYVFLPIFFYIFADRVIK